MLCTWFQTIITVVTVFVKTLAIWADPHDDEPLWYAAKDTPEQ